MNIVITITVPADHPWAGNDAPGQLAVVAPGTSDRVEVFSVDEGTYSDGVGD